MKLILVLLLLSTVIGVVKGQLRGCSEAIAAWADCALENCPNFDQACDPTNDEPQSCGELADACQEMSACCNSDACSSSLEGLLATCGMGVCGSISCSGGSSDAVTTPDDAAAGDSAADGGFNACSEAIAAFTSCTVANCPDIDQACDPTIDEAQDCGQLLQQCQEVSSCCNNNACSSEIEALLSTCALGVCGSLDCGGGSAGDEPETTTSGSACASINALAGASFALAMMA